MVLLSSCCSSSTPPGQASWNCWISDACSSDVRLGHGCCPSGIATEPLSPVHSRADEGGAPLMGGQLTCAVVCGRGRAG